MEIDVTSYALGKKNASAKLEQKYDVVLSQNGAFSIMPTTGFDGMREVTGTVLIPVYDGTVSSN